LNYYKKDDLVEVPLGWVNCQLADYKHQLQMGLMSLNLWPDDKANPIGTCVGYNNPNGPSTQLFVEFDTYHAPVVFPTVGNISKGNSVRNVPHSLDIIKDARPVTTKLSGKLSKLVGAQDILSNVDKLLATDPLYTLNLDEKKAVWEERKYLKTKPLSLPKLIQAVNYSDRPQVATLHKMLLKWPLIPPVIALELLDSKYSDSKVRQYAVKCLEQFTDDELSDYLLQLIQVLKYELYHDSDLARFLLRRCLLDRKLGHSFFWYLKV
jgi:phosphatidylinositol-4,5-bisphosphate 3-kinase